MPPRKKTEEAPVEETPGTDLIAQTEHRPEIVLLDTGARDRLLEHIEAEIEKQKPDTSTASGREKIKSFAFSITKTKTAAEKARLAMTAEARDRIKALNEAGKLVTEPLAELAKKARKPLTDWEEAEEARLDACKKALDRMRAAAIVPMGVTSEALRETITALEGENLAEDHWQGMIELATKAHATTLEALNAALLRVEQEEKDKAELEALRAAAREREEQERKEREAREAEEEAKRQRNAYIDSIIQHITDVGLGMIGGQPQPYGILLHELEEKVPPEIETFGERKDEVERHRVATLERIKDAMERKRLRDEQEEAERSEREKAEAADRKKREEAERQEIADRAAREAEERTRAEAQRKADEEAEQRQRQHDEALAAERRRADEAERQAAQERMDREADERERERRAKAAADERARLEASQSRRTQAKTEAKEALMTVRGVTEEMARAIIMLIMSGEVPRVYLDFAAEPKVKREPETAPEGALL